MPNAAACPSGVCSSGSGHAMVTHGRSTSSSTVFLPPAATSGATARRGRALVDPVEPVLERADRAIGGDAACDDHHRALGHVVLLHERADVTERDRRQLFVIAADQMRVRVVRRIDRRHRELRNELLRRPVAAADLVAHHLALAEELVLRDRPAAVPHARGLDLHQRVEQIRARVVHEVCRVPVGVPVRVERRLPQDLP
jgi:hypothetical protein